MLLVGSIRMKYFVSYANWRNLNRGSPVIKAKTNPLLSLNLLDVNKAWRLEMFTHVVICRMYSQFYFLFSRYICFSSLSNSFIFIFLVFNCNVKKKKKNFWGRGREGEGGNGVVSFKEYEFFFCFIFIFNTKNGLQLQAAVGVFPAQFLNWVI